MVFEVPFDPNHSRILRFYGSPASANRSPSVPLSDLFIPSFWTNPITSPGVWLASKPSSAQQTRRALGTDGSERRQGRATAEALPVPRRQPPFPKTPMIPPDQGLLSPSLPATGAAGQRLMVAAGQ